MPTVQFSIRDWSDEYSSVAFPIAEPIGTTTYADHEAGPLATFRSAVDGVTLGTIAREWERVYEGGNDQRPASALAQREFGLRVFYELDTSGEKRNLTIGAVDIAALQVDGGSDLVELADGGPMAALVSAMEAEMEVNGETITVTRAQIVGRNS